MAKHRGCNVNKSLQEPRDSLQFIIPFSPRGRERISSRVEGVVNSRKRAEPGQAIGSARTTELGEGEGACRGGDFLPVSGKEFFFR